MSRFSSIRSISAQPSVRGWARLQGPFGRTRDVLIEDIILLGDIVDDFLSVLVEDQYLPLQFDGDVNRGSRRECHHGGATHIASRDVLDSVDED
jgi:hypothetical protein